MTVFVNITLRTIVLLFNIFCLKSEKLSISLSLCISIYYYECLSLSLFEREKKISVYYCFTLLYGLFSTDCSLSFQFLWRMRSVLLYLSLCVYLYLLFLWMSISICISFRRKKKISFIESPTDVGGGIVYDTGSCTIRVDWCVSWWPMWQRSLN